MAVFTAIAAAVTAISSWTISFGVLGTFAVGNFLLQTAVHLGISALAVMFSGSGPKAAPFSIQGSVRTGGDVPRSFVFGPSLTAGSLVWHTEWGEDGGTPNAFYTQVIALSDLPVAGLRRWFIEGRAVTLGAVEGDYGYPATEYTENGKQHAWIKFHDGTQTVADPFLTTTVSSGAPRDYSASRVGVGIAYAIVTFRVNGEIFPGSFPRSKFVLDGVKLYDVSKDTSEGGAGSHRWADPQTWGGDGDAFPAVVAYNLARGLSFGGKWFYGLQGLTSARLPAAHWIAQIEKCRAPLPIGGGQTEPTFRCAGEITVNSEIGSAFEAVLTSCAGRMSETGGVFKIYVGAPDAPIASFTDAEIVSLAPQSFTPFFGLSNKVNGIVGSYPSPDEGYELRALPPLYNATYEAEDGGRRLLTSVELTFVPFHEQAQRLLLGEMKTARRARRHTHTLPARFRKIEPGDVVTWESYRNGYTNKQFRVDGIIDLPNCDLIVDITEVDPLDHGGWNRETDYVPVSVVPLNPVRPTAQGVVGFSVDASFVSDGGGAPRRPAALMSWDTSVDDIAGVEFRIRIAGKTAILSRTQTDDFAAGDLLVEAGLVSSVDYEAQARYITKAPRAVGWTAWLPFKTGDYKFDVIDLADAVFDKVALDTGAILADFDAEVIEPVRADLAPVVEAFPFVRDGVNKLTSDLKLRTDRLGSLEDAVDYVSDAILSATAALARLNGRLRDAGVYVDPETGQVRIEGVDAIRNDFGGFSSAVAIELDAVKSSLGLTVSRLELDGAISAALLDPTQIPIVDNLQLEFTELSLLFDGLSDSIALKAEKTVVDGLSVNLVAVQSSYDALNAAITSKVDNTSFDELEARQTVAEQEIAALDGASITQTVQDGRALMNNADFGEDATLASLLTAYKAKATGKRDLAYGVLELRALVDADRVAASALSLELGALIDESLALVESEALARADAVRALASDLTILQASLSAAAGKITALNTVNATSTSALVQALLSLTGRVGDAEGEVTALNTVNATSTSALVQALLSLTGRVGSTEGEVTALNTVNLTSGSALVQAFLTARAALDDPATGLNATRGLAEDIIDLNLAPGSALLSSVDRLQGSVGGDGLNSIPNAQITHESLWVLNGNWEMVTPSANVGLRSTGRFRYNYAGGSGSNHHVESEPFSVVGGATYVARSQATRAGSGVFRVRLRIRWRDEDGALIGAATSISDEVVSSAGIKDFAREMVAPAEAKTATWQATAKLDETTGVFSVAAPEFARIPDTLLAARGEIAEINNVDITSTSAIVQRLLSVESEVIDEGGESLKTKVSVNTGAVDGVKGVHAIKIDQNGRISGFGLVADLIDGEPVSAFNVVADRISFAGPDGSLSQLFDVFATDTVVDGVTVPAGVYLRTAYIRDAFVKSAMIKDGTIGNAKIGNTIEADGYTENANGLPTAGWQIKKNGKIKTAGDVISRDQIIDTGKFDIGTFPGDGQFDVAADFELAKTLWIETATPVAAWKQEPHSYTATVGHGGGGVTGPGGWNAAMLQNCQWNMIATPTAVTRFYGNNRIWLKVEIYGKNVASFDNYKLDWSLRKVT